MRRSENRKTKRKRSENKITLKTRFTSNAQNVSNVWYNYDLTRLESADMQPHLGIQLASAHRQFETMLSACAVDLCHSGHKHRGQRRVGNLCMPGTVLRHQVNFVFSIKPIVDTGKTRCFADFSHNRRLKVYFCTAVTDQDSKLDLLIIGVRFSSFVFTISCGLFVILNLRYAFMCRIVYCQYIVSCRIESYGLTHYESIRLQGSTGLSRVFCDLLTICRSIHCHGFIISSRDVVTSG